MVDKRLQEFIRKKQKFVQKALNVIHIDNDLAIKYLNMDSGINISIAEILNLKSNTDFEGNQTKIISKQIGTDEEEHF